MIIYFYFLSFYDYQWELVLKLFGSTYFIFWIFILILKNPECFEKEENIQNNKELMKNFYN
jgi:hypothetical protein